MKLTSGRTYWAIYDPHTNELCVLCETRGEARELARDCGVVLRVERIR